MVFPAAKLHSASPSDCLQKGGIGLALILKKIGPFYPLQPALLRSASPIFFVWVVKFCGPIH